MKPVNMTVMLTIDKLYLHSHHRTHQLVEANLHPHLLYCRSSPSLLGFLVASDVFSCNISHGLHRLLGHIICNSWWWLQGWLFTKVCHGTDRPLKWFHNNHICLGPLHKNFLKMETYSMTCADMYTSISYFTVMLTQITFIVIVIFSF